MDFDLILDHLGHIGKFQYSVMLLAGIAQIFGGMQMHSSIFLTTQDRSSLKGVRCFVPNCDNDSTKFHETFAQFALPSITDEFGSSPSPCDQFKIYKDHNACVPHAFNINKTIPCSKFIWDHLESSNTSVSQINILCKKKRWNGISSNTIFMLGALFGSPGCGMFADKYGRKNLMMVASFFLLTSSVGTYFAPSFGIFSFLRFMTAATVSGLFQSGYILAVEFTGTTKRLICANVMQIIFLFGEMILSLVAYFVRKWKVLELVISVPSAILFIYYWWLPESARWQISKGKNEQAKKTILKAAKWNKATIPEHLLRASDYSDYVEIESENGARQQSAGPLSLVKSPTIRKWSINMSFTWIVNAMVYYGLTLSIKNLSGSTYANFAILALIEVPAILLSTVALSFCGRKPVLCFVMVFGGLACGSTVFVPQALHWVTTIIAVLGKSAIAASFAIIYIYSSEIYPTSLRSTGLGFCSMFASIGGIAAPLIHELKKVYLPLPMIIFAVASVISGFLILFLPETHNKLLPESIDETESFGFSRDTEFERLLRRPRNLRQLGSTAPRGLCQYLDEGTRLLGPNSS